MKEKGDFRLQEIPIFFSTDDQYIPYLDVAISSLIDHASTAYQYRIVVLNTGLSPEGVAKIQKNERPGFSIDFVDISDELKDIQSKLKNVYHFSIVTYYRLFIASLFPQYGKVIYLDCDLVVRKNLYSANGRRTRSEVYARFKVLVGPPALKGLF